MTWLGSIDADIRVDCCACNNDDFDLCSACYSKGYRCRCPVTDQHIRQLQLNGIAVKKNN